MHEHRMNRENKEIDTERLRLTALQKRDLDGFFALCSDPRVRSFLGGPISSDQIQSKFEEALASPPSTPHWVIRNKADNTSFVGTIDLSKHHDSSDLEVSYMLLPQFWGKGFGTEVLSGVIDFGFSELKLPIIVAETQTANKASCAILEKVGMKLRKTLQRFGEEQALYEIAASDELFTISP